MSRTSNWEEGSITIGKVPYRACGRYEEACRLYSYILHKTADQLQLQ